MFYYIYELLQGIDIPGVGLFRYISFRSAMAFVLALLIAIPVGKRMIAYLQRRQFGEQVRDLGLAGQKAKEGTPTMGGVIIIAATLVPTLLFAKLTNVYVVIMLVSLIWLGAIGLTDDLLKSRRHTKAGLNGWYKILFQALLGLFVALSLNLSPQAMVPQAREQAEEARVVEVLGVGEQREDLSEKPPRERVKNLRTTIPFFKNNELDYRKLVPIEGRLGRALAWGLFTLVVILIVLSVSNGANLTDGLDGLATGVTAPVAVTLMVLAYVSGNAVYSSYLHIIYIPYIGELVVFMSAFLGALIGFLWNNAYPAKIFMGDTGSLTIGGVIGIYSVLVRKELMLPILCGVFLVESLSVILQVSYFKYTRHRYGEGRRIFLMTPIHHHYQKKGIPEPRIVMHFWIVSMLLSVLAIVTVKIR